MMRSVYICLRAARFPLGDQDTVLMTAASYAPIQVLSISPDHAEANLSTFELLVLLTGMTWSAHSQDISGKPYTKNYIPYIRQHTWLHQWTFKQRSASSYVGCALALAPSLAKCTIRPRIPYGLTCRLARLADLIHSRSQSCINCSCHCCCSKEVSLNSQIALYDLPSFGTPEHKHAGRTCRVRQWRPALGVPWQPNRSLAVDRYRRAQPHIEGHSGHAQGDAAAPRQPR